MAANKKPKSKSVDPKVLGTGAARKAGDALKNRQKRLEEEMKKAGAKKPTKKKKSMYA